MMLDITTVRIGSNAAAAYVCTFISAIDYCSTKP